MSESRILIKANSVVDLGNGIFGIMLPERQMSEAERNLLRNLFPNLIDQVYNLIDREALISAMVTEPITLTEPVTKTKKKSNSYDDNSEKEDFYNSDDNSEKEDFYNADYNSGKEKYFNETLDVDPV